MSKVFIGRQAIFNAEQEVIAYELLFRSDDLTNAAQFIDGDKATSEVILNTFTEIGLQQIVGKLPPFINFGRSFLLNTHFLPQLPKHTVIEVLEGIEVDEILLQTLRSLSERGYKIALDDFLYHPQLEPLVELANIIKLDLSQIEMAEMPQHIAQIRRPDLKLLAEKVETHAQFEACKALGFDYFQGYFLCKPQIIEGRKLPTNKIGVLRLLAKLQDPEINLGELETLIKSDVSMSYRLLKYVNSAEMARRREISSIHDAIMLLGWQSIRRIATLVALSRIDDKPRELMIMSLIRAHMCESLGGNQQIFDVNYYFTVGLFSTLDAMLDLPMAQILEDISLSSELRNALLRHEGPLGQMLRCTLQYERGDVESLFCNEDFTAEELAINFMRAVGKADQTSRMLST